MKTKFSRTWKSSVQPRRQRKYIKNAPLHVKGTFLHAHLAKELRIKYKRRTLRVHTGDKIRILRGQFKKLEGKVDKVDVKRTRIYVSKVEITKKDGSKARIPIHPSNVLILELNLQDKQRTARLS
jgi:large subunit ribosomal protein L24